MIFAGDVGGMVGATKWKCTSQAIHYAWAPSSNVVGRINHTLVRHCVSAMWTDSGFSLFFQFLLRLDLLRSHPLPRIQGCVAKGVLKITYLPGPFRRTKRKYLTSVTLGAFQKLRGI